MSLLAFANAQSFSDPPPYAIVVLAQLKTQRLSFNLIPCGLLTEEFPCLLLLGLGGSPKHIPILSRQLPAPSRHMPVESPQRERHVRKGVFLHGNHRSEYAFSSSPYSREAFTKPARAGKKINYGDRGRQFHRAKSGAENETTNRPVRPGLTCCPTPERILCEALAAAGILPENLPRLGKSAAVKVAVAQAIRANTMASSAWLAKALHLGSAANVRKLLRQAKGSDRD